MPLVVLLLTALVGAIFALWINIRIVKSKVAKWAGDLAIIFVFSIGSLDKRKTELWTERGFSTDDANIIVKQQPICLLEMPIGFVVGGILSAYLSR